MISGRRSIARYTQDVVSRFVPLAVGLASALVAQDAPPRSKLADYPSHAQFVAFDVGAEYLVHNIPLEKGEYWARDYLVVEVAIFPHPEERVRVSSNHFALRINGKKQLSAPDSVGSVAASLRFSDWETHPSLTAGAGIGDASVSVGGPPSVSRFPGDPTGMPPRPIPENPNGRDPYGVTPDQGRPLDQAIAIAALPEGRFEKPVKGCLFFHFSGKLKSIQVLDLVYDSGDAPPASISLIKPQ